MICRLCPNKTERDYPHCPECILKLLAQGICKWCGVGSRPPKSPRSRFKRSDYCSTCSLQARQNAKDREGRGLPISRPRTEGAKEHIKETKFGPVDQSEW